MKEPECCGKPMTPTPQYIKPGHRMYEVSYLRGVPIYLCQACGRAIWSEDRQATEGESK